MNDELYFLVNQLKKALKEDERIKEFEIANSELENCSEAKILSYKMENASREYNDILKIYQVDSPEAKSYLKKLYEAKKELDKIDAVKRYNKAYRAIKELDDKINKEIFYPFNGLKCKR